MPPCLFINMDNCAFCQFTAVALVNVFSLGPGCAIPVAVLCSPGLPEMNPSISLVSLCICAERKHDPLQLGTSLNKSRQRLSHEPAGTPREKGGGGGGGWWGCCGVV